jgi:hypothetical protein
VRYGDKPPGGTEVLGRGADVVATAGTIAEIAAVLAVAWLYARRRLDLVAAVAASVLAFVAFAKVFSPQYVDWLVPVVPAVGVLESALLVPVLLLTRHVFDHQNDIHHTGSTVWWLLVRNLWVVGLYAVVLLRSRMSRSA